MTRNFGGCRRIGILVAAALLSPAFIGVGPVKAQAGSVPAPTQTPGTTTAESAPDLALLRKALAVFAGTTLRVETEFQIDAKGSGAAFTYREHIAIHAKRPGKFRSTVTMYAPDGGQGARYLVVNDGAKVFTYRPGARQYSTATRKAWEASDEDLPVLGLFGSAFMEGFLSDVAKGLGGGDSKTTLETLKTMGLTLTGSPETVDGAELYAYTLDFGGAENTTYRFLIDPAAAVIKQVELKTKDRKMELVMKEKILRLWPTPTIPAGTFRFAPPPGAKKVNQLTVEPFK